MTILRWHISRVYRDFRGKENVNTLVKAEIAFSKDDLDLSIEDFSDPDMADNIDWWISDEYEDDEKSREKKKGDKEPSEEIYWGLITTEKDFFDTILKKNFKPDLIMRDKSIEKRMIDEDMVFLQFFDKDLSLEYFEDIVWDKKKNSADIGRILHWPTARWLDFTLPARKMSKEIYKQALGTNAPIIKEAE